MLRAGINAVMATTKAAFSSIGQRNRPSLIAVCQMTSDNDMEENWKVAERMIDRAGGRGAKVIFFPECFDFVGRSKEEQVTLAIPENGDFIGRFRAAARKHGLWMSLGGFHHKDGTELPWNSHIVIDSEGETRASYNKLHLFDLEIPGKVRLMESEFSKAGKEMIPPVVTPIGRLGLGICYDLRFPELSLWNREKGAEILSFPSAFTLNTGLAHWETLLRARAIETQCYVVAAAQTGSHNPKRQSFGHALVVDPWGAVIAQCSERVGMCFAEVDAAYVREIREMQPVFAHRRRDLYTLHVNERLPTDESLLKFGQYEIPPSQIFARTAHSFAFVNLKPVLNGHVLLCPLRPVSRLTEMTDAETADLFILAKKVQAMLERVHGVNSATVCVQDGPNSGQTITNVHVHILARRADDFGGSTDTLYKELADHDKDANRKSRTEGEMAEEACKYRQAMRECQ